MVVERLSSAEVGELINIGSGEEVSIASLPRSCERPSTRMRGRTCEIVWDTSRPNGTPRKLLDSSRIRALGWAPLTPLAEGLARAYDDYLSGLE